MATRKKSEPKKREAVSVRYVGRADIKELSGHVWGPENDHTVSVSEISDDLLEYLRSQPDFRIVYE